MFETAQGYSQTQRKADTLVISDEEIKDIIFYSARDSIFSDLKKKQIHLYGDAKVTSESFKMSAGYILIDLEKNELLAMYATDTSGNRVEFPIFEDGGDEAKASSIRYNFKTKKGYLQELAIKQQEMFLYMDVAKRHPNDQLHFRKGRFTTCDLEDPHYHFQLSKAVMVPEERIVTGAMNLWIKGVPTPLGLPFSIIPQQKERTHGILFPEIIPLSAYGFGFQNLGYFFPINDHFQTSVYTNIYSRGSWGIRDVLDYAKRYGYRGTLDVGFQQFKSGFPADVNQNKVSVSWVHRKEQRSNPYWSFASNVNFISDNQSKNNLDPINEQYFNNSFNSDINLNRFFPGKPITMGMKLSLRQNSLSQNISLDAPVFNLNVSRFFPFSKFVKKSSGIGEMIKRIGVTYNFEGKNQSTFKDTLLRDGNFSEIGSQFFNGLNQQVALQTSAGFFRNTLKFNPSISYGNKVNFQQIEKTVNPSTNTVITDTVSRGGMIHELSFNAQFSTVLYSYYKFIGKRQPLLRHVMTPNIGFRYSPQLNELKSYQLPNSSITSVYSPFERSIYSGSTGRTSGQITFGLNNTFELKRKSDKDTVTGFKKNFIIDQLSITGNYDLMKDSMNLSDIQINMRVNPSKWLNFVASSTFSPYDWDNETGKTLSSYAVSSSGKLGRFLRNDFATTLTLTSEKGRQEIEETKETAKENWNTDFDYFALHPEYAINFNIPWKVNLSHVYSINSNTAISENAPDKLIIVQTLVIGGDVSFTKRWNLSTTTNLDLKEGKITNSRITLTRNMHCWALAFYWTPIGGNKSFLLSIRNTSSLFSAAKVEFRKPPVFL
jgi:hypothetical protein